MTIEQYLAAGGSITRCPTVYLLPVTGAAPIRSGVSDRVDESSLPLKQRKRKSKEEWLARARATKKARGPSERELAVLAEHRDRLRLRAIEEAAKLRMMWERGEPLEEIARLRGCSIPTVKKILRKAGARNVTTARNQITGRMTELPGNGLEMHHQGYTAKQIAKHVGLDHTTVRRILREAGLVPNKVPVGLAPHPNTLPTETVAEISRLYAEGVGSLAISKRLGIAKSTVLNNLRRLGVVIRPAKGATS